MNWEDMLDAAEKLFTIYGTKEEYCRLIVPGAYYACLNFAQETAIKTGGYIPSNRGQGSHIDLWEHYKFTAYGGKRPNKDLVAVGVDGLALKTHREQASYNKPAWSAPTANTKMALLLARDLFNQIKQVKF